MARRKKDDPTYILRLSRGAGCWLEIACRGTKVTVAWYIHGVVDMIYRPPVTCSLGEFAFAFVKAYPKGRYAETLHDLIADESVW